MRCLTVRPAGHNLARDFDNFFADFFAAPVWRSEEPAGFSPRVNVRETDSEISLTFELPGMEKGNIKVTVVDDNLTVSGKRELEDESKENGYLRSEINSGSFSRSFTLPESVNKEKISADYENGLLEVKLAKLEEVRPREIDVKVS